MTHRETCSILSPRGHRWGSVIPKSIRCQGTGSWLYRPSLGQIPLLRELTERAIMAAREKGALTEPGFHLYGESLPSSPLSFSWAP